MSNHISLNYIGAGLINLNLAQRETLDSILLDYENEVNSKIEWRDYRVGDGHNEFVCRYIDFKDSTLRDDFYVRANNEIEYTSIQLCQIDSVEDYLEFDRIVNDQEIVGSNGLILKRYHRVSK